MPPRLSPHALKPLFRIPQRRYAHTPLFQTVPEPKKKSKIPWIPLLAFSAGLIVAYDLTSEIIRSNSYLPFLSNKTHQDSRIEGSVTRFMRSMRADKRFQECEPYPDLDPAALSTQYVGGACGDGEAVGHQSWFVRGDWNVIGVCYLGRKTAGIPTVVHGGLIYSLMEEAVSRSGILRSNSYGEVVEMKVDYKKPTRVRQFVVVDAVVSGENERGVIIDVNFAANDGGAILAKGRGVFVPYGHNPVDALRRKEKEMRRRKAEAQAAGVSVIP